ncbi:uncharacterized protein TNCV_4731561 [Trichonephila clavipes]|nr:uncharacterized protein TNCV_4731561 [Trichonephila clavipes]
MSKFYDSFSLFTPITVIIKILLQDTWLIGIKCDELLPTAVVQQWYKWVNELQCLNDIHNPKRWIESSETSNITIYVFCDASESEFGACLYAQPTVDTFTEVNLISKRSKLAPVKKGYSSAT